MASKLQVTASKLQVTASKLQVTASKLQVTASKLRVTPTKLQVTPTNYKLPYSYLISRVLNFAILSKPYFARLYFRDFDGQK